ncbi:winged-helix domain-containing protein [Leifsonia sp. NPDC058194]|uniref:winged-helix domain-containing protein n=1 Tax=Leifsonia sp. NPDC058194 TaxID=3346374 RepID=UPI0036DA636A
MSVLAESSSPYLERNVIADTIHSRFGIEIPALVVRRLLRGLGRAGFTESIGENAVAITAKGQEEAPALQQEVTQYQRRQSDLISAFGSFVHERFPDRVDVLTDDPGGLLASYFERHAAPLLNQSIRGSRKPSEPTPGADFLVASFVTHLAEHDQVRFGYVVEAAKGAMLAAVLLLDTSGLKESLADLYLVIDTPVLMDVLGFHGDVAQAAARQLVSLACAQSAKLVTFDHSVSELEGILEHVTQALRKGNRSRSTSTGFLHFSDIGASPADIALLLSQVHRLLADEQIEVISRPDGYYQYGLDESKLEDLIQSKVHYFQDAARVNDVMSLSSTHRLRRGRTTKTLEHCRAVLVTSNANLVMGAVEFDERGGGFPLAITTDALAGILWVRSPASGPDTPREMLLASAYAGMQPSPSTWSRYLDEVERLESTNTVSADEAVILRTSRISRESLMQETLGQSEAVNAESPINALNRVRSEATAPLEDQVRELTDQAAEAAAAVETATGERARQEMAREQAESQLADASQANHRLEAELARHAVSEAAKRENIRKRAKQVARGWRNGAIWTVRVVALVVIAWAVWVFVTRPDPADRLGVIIVGLVGFAGLVLALVPPLGRILDPIENWLAERGERKRLMDAGYAVERVSSMVVD